MSWSRIFKRSNLGSVDQRPYAPPDFSASVPVGSNMLMQDFEPGDHFVSGAVARIEGAGPANVEVTPPPPQAAPEPPPELAEELKRKLFEQGYEQGQRVGQELAEKKFEPSLVHFEQVIEDLGALRRKIIQRSEGDIVDLALEIAQKVIQQELTLNRDILADMIRTALSDFGAKDEITIRMGPEDHRILKSATSKILEGSEGIENIALQVDESIAEGGCVIETHFGNVDLRIDKQLEEIARSMGIGNSGDE